jgi:hypothetical protein
MPWIALVDASTLSAILVGAPSDDPGLSAETSGYVPCSCQERENESKEKEKKFMDSTFERNDNNCHDYKYRASHSEKGSHIGSPYRLSAL